MGTLAETASQTITQTQAYLSNDGALLHSLVLRDAQFGSVGESGTLWTVKPDGSWRQQSFINAIVGKAEYEGIVPRRAGFCERRTKIRIVDSETARSGL